MRGPAKREYEQERDLEERRRFPTVCGRFTVKMARAEIVVALYKRTLDRPRDCGGTPMDIVVWLRSLSLGRYEAVFRENDIDTTVLPSLTHETLKDLGVVSVGHREKLEETRHG